MKRKSGRWCCNNLMYYFSFSSNAKYSFFFFSIINVSYLLAILTKIISQNFPLALHTSYKEIAVIINTITKKMFQLKVPHVLIVATRHNIIIIKLITLLPFRNPLSKFVLAFSHFQALGLGLSHISLASVYTRYPV